MRAALTWDCSTRTMYATREISIRRLERGSERSASAVPMRRRIFPAVYRCARARRVWELRSGVMRSGAAGLPALRPLRGVFVAEIDEQLCGFVVASYAVGVAELESVAVKRAHSADAAWVCCCAPGRWCGRVSAGRESMELEVRESNTGALALYGRMRIYGAGAGGRSITRTP